MRRATVIIGLTSSVTVIALAALVYGISSHQSLSVDNPRPDKAGLTQQAPSAHETASTIVPQQSRGTVQDPAVSEHLSDTDYVPPCTFADEENSSKMVRAQATRKVTKVYSLLFDRLDLTSSTRDALLSVLIEIQIDATSTPCVRSKNIDKQEQSDRIAAVIGDTKLKQFLELAQDLGSYAELVYMESVLEKHDLPMTEAEQGRVLEILIDIPDRELVLPGADAKRGSIEYLEYRLAKIDERDRLFFEQAASVLSPEQVGYLFAQYQRESYRRADALERQKKARADDNAEDLPLHFPMRSSPNIPQ